MSDKKKQPSDQSSTSTRCRVCGNKLSDTAQPYGPFCSARCKMQDLSKWFGENYRIASSPAQPPEGGDDPDT